MNWRKKTSDSLRPMLNLLRAKQTNKCRRKRQANDPEDVFGFLERFWRLNTKVRIYHSRTYVSLWSQLLNSLHIYDIKINGSQWVFNCPPNKSHLLSIQKRPHYCIMYLLSKVNKSIGNNANCLVNLTIACYYDVAYGVQWLDRCHHLLINVL